MAKSRRLRLRDLRRLYRLLGECCELGADPVAWRQHMAEQLAGLFGAQIGMYAEYELSARPFRDLFWLRPQAAIDFGWPTPGDRKPFEAHIRTGRPEDGPHVTPDLLRRQFKIFHWSGDLGRDEWQQSPFFNEYVKQCHLDDGIFAHHLIDSRHMRWMFINRALGDRPFTKRDARLMRLLNMEQAGLLGSRLARVGEPGVIDLPSRQRDVLACLMEGDSEKQAALRLGISRNTVHDYVKQLHTRFGVRSRGELLSRCRSFWPVLKWLDTRNGSGAVDRTAAIRRALPS